VKLAPTIGAPSNLDTRQAPTSGDAVGAQSLSIASSFGHTKEQYLAMLKLEREEAAA
jgi:hypothetical protein